MEYEEEDLVLCTVDRIIGTNVFVKLDDGTEGSIVVSEIAPGRIRNLREYVVPKKKLVCKILKIDSTGHLHLSLRRVKEKEKKEILEEEKQEKSITSIFKSILNEKSTEVIKKIKSENLLTGFVNEAKNNPKILEKIIGKEDSQKILEILNSQKTKKTSVKKEIRLIVKNPEGVNIIKNLFNDLKEIEAKYISGGKYTLKIESEDAKKSENQILEVIKELEKKAKTYGAELTVK